MLTTTLAKIRSYRPCESGWVKLLKHLDKTKPDDVPLSLATILKSNGVADTLWCLRACDGAEMFARYFALDMARRVYPIWHAKHPTNNSVKNCIDVTERFLSGMASREELQKARNIYAYANSAAAYAAYAAAYAAYAADAADAAYAAYAAYAADAADAAYAAYANSAAERKWQAKHLAACLKAWPKKPWPNVTPIKVKKDR